MGYGTVFMVFVLLGSVVSLMVAGMGANGAKFAWADPGCCVYARLALWSGVTAALMLAMLVYSQGPTCALGKPPS